MITKEHILSASRHCNAGPVEPHEWGPDEGIDADELGQAIAEMILEDPHSIKIMLPDVMLGFAWGFRIGVLAARNEHLDSIVG